VTFGLTHPSINISGLHSSTASRGNQVVNGSGNFSIAATSNHAKISTIHFLTLIISLDILLEVTIGFNLFPFSVYKQELTAASVGSVVADFRGFSNVINDVSNQIGSGAPLWFANNRNKMNTEMQVFVAYINQRLSSFLSLDNVFNAIQNYSPATC
jgi:hypothetical protein